MDSLLKFSSQNDTSRVTRENKNKNNKKLCGFGFWVWAVGWLLLVIFYFFDFLFFFSRFFSSLLVLEVPSLRGEGAWQTDNTTTPVAPIQTTQHTSERECGYSRPPFIKNTLSIPVDMVNRIGCVGATIASLVHQTHHSMSVRMIVPLRRQLPCPPTTRAQPTPDHTLFYTNPGVHLHDHRGDHPFLVVHRRYCGGRGNPQRHRVQRRSLAGELFQRLFNTQTF